MECCEFSSPVQIGDAAAVIEIKSGSPDWVDDIEIFAEACYNEDGSTGYCLAPHHRILTSDLRWVPGRELQIGDELLAFEESPQPQNRHRRLQRSVVTHSHSAMKESVLVSLDNGDIIQCSEDHPWLTRHANNQAKWRSGDKLVGSNPTKFLDTWETDSSYGAGWLAGMLDGEETLTWSSAKTGYAVRMSVAQKPGLAFDAVKHELSVRKFPTTESKAPQRSAQEIYIAGFQEILRALGSLRPIRLLNRFRDLPIEHRGLLRRPNRIPQILRVEPIGLQEVQCLSTSTKTYLAEGYAMHNTDTYEDSYGDPTEGGLYPFATATATFYQLIRMPPNSTLTIDATARTVTLTDSDTGLAIGGLETLEFNNLWRWIQASRGGCQRICIDADEAHTNADSTVRILSYAREV